MRKRGLLLAIGILLIVNSVVLLGVWYNRSGEPDAAIILTERELPVAYSFQEENSGVSLSINASHHFYNELTSVAFDTFDWLDRKKLESLGFRFLSVPAIDKSGELYDKQLPRRAFAVLEYEGTAWESWKKRLSDELGKVDGVGKEGKKTPQAQDNLRKNIEGIIRNGSRLFSIDAGQDPVALRRQYPDRQHYLILPAKVRVSYTTYPADRKADIHGYVEILTSEVYVPKPMHRYLGEQKKPSIRYSEGIDTPAAEPRYQVELHTGKRYEPWIKEVKSIQKSR